jgi:hypothetical protein
MFPEFRTWKIELMDNGNFRLVAANRNGKRPFFDCKWKQKQKFVFLCWLTLNGNRQLLFQQTCPSMQKTNKV